MNDKKVVAVFGGSGFIGTYTIKELVKNDYNVISISRSRLSHEFDNIYHISEINLDINISTQSDLQNILQNVEICIFATGADDRHIPYIPAYDYFHHMNVENCVKIVKAAKVAGVKKFIVLSSYFAYFSRANHEWNLDKYHPYIKSRLVQENLCLKEETAVFKIYILELPYIIGSPANKPPLLKPLVKYINSPMPFLVFTRGGTAVVSIHQLAKLITTICNNSYSEDIIPVVSENLSWEEILNLLGNEKKILYLPTFLLKIFGFFLNIYFHLINKESGLNPYHYMDIQTKNLFLEKEHLFEYIKFDSNDLIEDFKAVISNSE